MATDIQRWTNACLDCRRRKTIADSNAGTNIPFEEPTKLFEQFGIDYVGPFTPTKKYKFKYILTATCFYSRYPFAVPVEDCTGTTAAKCLFKYVFSHFGTPKRILSDRGSHFTSELMTELYGVLGIEKLTTSAYRPQENGRCERFHRYLNSALTMESNRSHDNWDEAIPAILFSYRISDTESIGMSPFEAVFGFQPNLPTDLLYGNAGDLARYANKHHFDLPLRWRQVHDRVLAHREAYDSKRFARLRRKMHPVAFEVGELVMLQVPPYQLMDNLKDDADLTSHSSVTVSSAKKSVGLTTKLLYRWNGPHKIAEKLSTNTYKLAGLPSPQNVVHCARLARYVPFLAVHMEREQQKASKNENPPIEEIADLAAELIEAPELQFDATSEPDQTNAVSNVEIILPPVLKDTTPPRLPNTFDRRLSLAERRATRLGHSLMFFSKASLDKMVRTAEDPESKTLLSRLRELNKQIAALNQRMLIPKQPYFTTISDAESRLSDLNGVAEHIISLNNLYDSEWELLHMKGDNEFAPLVFMSNNKFSPLRPESFLPDEPLPPDPRSAPSLLYQDGTCNVTDDFFSKEDSELSFQDPSSSFSNLNEEPRVADIHPLSFLPGVSRAGRPNGKPPQKFIYLMHYL